MNDPSNTPWIAGAMFAFFAIMLLWCIRGRPRREEITLRQFGAELLDEKMPRWAWWIILMILIWKL